MSNELLHLALKLRPAARYRLAFLIAESLGYVLIKDASPLSAAVREGK